MCKKKVLTTVAFVLAITLALATASSAMAAFDTLEFGGGPLQPHATPTPVVGLQGKEATAVAAGAEHALALLGNGTVDAWGHNEFGQLGQGECNPHFEGFESTTALAVCGLGSSKVTGIAGGERFSLAVREDGKVLGWGSDESGQLGPKPGVGLSSSTPIEVENLPEAKAVAAGQKFGLALLKNGTVVGWGSGAVGGSTLSEVGAAQPICLTKELPCPENEVMRGVKAIAAGGDHALALLSNGKVMTWGEGADGQLGNGKLENSEVPREVCAVGETKLPCELRLEGVRAIAAGYDQDLALLGNGTVRAWGENGGLPEKGVFGEGGIGVLGDGKFGAEQPFSDVPVAVCAGGEAGCTQELSGVSTIAAGVCAYQSLASLKNGALLVWGNVPADVSPVGHVLVPTHVPGLSHVTSAAGGNFFPGQWDIAVEETR